MEPRGAHTVHGIFDRTVKFLSKFLVKFWAPGGGPGPPQGGPGGRSPPGKVKVKGKGKFVRAPPIQGRCYMLGTARADLILPEIETRR